MKPSTPLTIALCFLGVLVDAYHLPTSLTDAADGIKKHGWGRKKKAPVSHEPPADGNYPKYFHEPQGGQELQHYDARYHQVTLGHDEKCKTQLHLIQSYLEFFTSNRLETWLAHGTLLGWWWNARLLPWDWDIDTQVSLETMIHLAENHNDTRYSYTSRTTTEFDPATSKQVPVARQYHLDVNPAVFTRHRGDGANIIDARWIDVRNGLYIDITAVAEISPAHHPGIWACKNYHLYRTRDLWPLRETTYEDITVRVPYNYNRILSEEYGAGSLVVDEFQGHRWSSADAVWQKKPPDQIEREGGVNALNAKWRKMWEKAQQYRVETEAFRTDIYQKDEEARVREQEERELKDKVKKLQELKEALKTQAEREQEEAAAANEERAAE